MLYFFGSEIADIFDFVLAAGFAAKLVFFSIPGDAFTDMLMLRFIGRLNKLIIIHT